MANHPCQGAKKTVIDQDYKKTIVANGETPRLECDSTATGKERERESGAAGPNEATGLKPNGGSEADRARGQQLPLSCKQRMKIGTWNVCSMQSGKINIIQKEVKQLEIKIMGLSETRWKGQGHFNWNKYKIIMLGQAEKGRNGVAIMCDRTSANIMGYDTVSDGILSVRFRGRKVNIKIVQVCSNIDGIRRRVGQLFQQTTKHHRQN